MLVILTIFGLFTSWRKKSYKYEYQRIISKLINDIRFGFGIILLIIYSVINAINYWIWDVVKSAYKQIKDENTANSYPDAYPMNVVTYQKPTAPMKYQA